MGNFEGKGCSLNLKSDKERVLSSLISRINHLPKISTPHVGKCKNYKKLEKRTIKNLTERRRSPMAEQSMKRILDEESVLKGKKSYEWWLILSRIRYSFIPRRTIYNLIVCLFLCTP